MMHALNDERIHDGVTMTFLRMNTGNSLLINFLPLPIFAIMNIPHTFLLQQYVHAPHSLCPSCWACAYPKIHPRQRKI